MKGDYQQRCGPLEIVKSHNKVKAHHLRDDRK